MPFPRKLCGLGVQRYGSERDRAGPAQDLSWGISQKKISSGLLRWITLTAELPFLSYSYKDGDTKQLTRLQIVMREG
jgi:hypothetical protein